MLSTVVCVTIPTIAAIVGKVTDTTMLRMQSVGIILKKIITSTQESDLFSTTT